MTDITVLHVDDDPDFAELTASALEREDGLSVVSVTDPTAVPGRVEVGGVDCVVSDYEMPEMDGLTLLRRVREAHPDLPLVLFTGKGSEEVASEAISVGVDDYLQKEGGIEQFELLANRVRNVVSRYRAERERAESERRLSTLVSNIPGMAYRDLNEPEWPDVYVSDGCEELTGYRPEQLVDGDVRWEDDVTHPDDRGVFWDEVQESLAAREHFEITYRIVTADGDEKWVWERGRGVYEDGEPVAIEGFISDVTERVRMEEALRDLNAKVGSLHDVATRLASTGEESTVYDLAIEAAENVLEFSICYVAEAVDDHFLLQAVSEELPDDRFREMSLDAGAVGAAYQRGEPLLVEDAFDHPDAEPVDDTYPSGISLPVGDLGVFQALSTEPGAFDEDDLELARLLVAHVAQALERVRTRRSLRAERDRFATLFENIPDPSAVVEFVEDEPVVRSINSAFEETFGYTAAAARGESVDDLIVPDERMDVGRQINRDVVSGEHVEREVRREAAGGELRDFLFRSVTVEDGESPMLGFGVYTDVTEQHRYREELERRNEYLDAFARVASHDLRTPLTLANGRLDLVAEECDSPHVAGVERALTEMERLVEDVLTLARTDDELSTSAVDLGAAVERAGEPFEGWGTVGTAGTLPTIEANGDALGRLLENLLRNAVDHGSTSPPSQAREDAVEHGSRRPPSVGSGPPVSTETGQPSEDDDGGGVSDPVTIEVGWMNGLDEGVEGFYLEDDGPGLPDGALDGNFEDGWSFEGERAGLGLAIVTDIARSHGWSVDATGGDDGGARFEITGVRRVE